MIAIRVRTFLIVVLALNVLTACTKDPAALMKRAEEREAKGEYSAAIVDLKSVLQQEPNNGIARYRLGRVHNLTFDGPSAEKELRRAVELGVVEGGRVALELARSLVIQRKTKEILDAVTPTPAFEPSVLASAYAIRGHAQLTLGKVEEAKAERDKVYKIDRENVDLLLLDARFKAGERNLPDAMKLVDHVIKHNPRNFEAWTYKVDLLSMQNRWDDVLAAYGELLGLNPRHLDALVGRAQLLLRQGKLDDAQKDVDSLAKFFARYPATAYLQGQVHFARGKYREALEAAQLVLKRSPDYDYALLLSGMAHLALGAVAQAERELSQYLLRNPRNWYARRVLATAQVELNQGAKALETLDPILRSELRNAALLSLASDAYSRVGENSKAAEMLERAAAANLDNPKLFVRQAQLHLTAGEVDLAIADLERASALSEGITHAATVLVLAYSGRREFDKALSAILEMEKKAPKSPQPAYLRGLVLLEKGDPAGAVKNFEAAVRIDAKFIPAVISLAKLDAAAGKQESARKRFVESLRLDESNLQILLSYASLEESSGRTKEAEALLERAVKSAPNAIEPKLRLARLAVQAGDKSRARAIADDVIAAHRDHPMAIELLGGVQMWSGDRSSGIATLSRLTTLFPGSAESFYKLAGAQLAAFRLKEAEINLRKALALRRDFGAAETMLLRLFVDNQRVDDGLAYAKSIQRENPNSPKGYLVEAELWQLQNKPREALGPLRRAMELRPSSENIVRMSKARAASGDLHAATTELRAWVDKHPKDKRARAALADVLSEAGYFEEAVPQLEHLIQENGEHPLLLNNLAWGYYKLKDPRALATAERAYKYLPNSALVVDTLGFILVEQGQLKQGLGLLQSAVKLAPENHSIRYHWAVALARAGQIDLARKELNRLLKSNPQFPYASEASQLLISLQ